MAPWLSHGGCLLLYLVLWAWLPCNCVQRRSVDQEIPGSQTSTGAIIDLFARKRQNDSVNDSGNVAAYDVASPVLWPPRPTSVPAVDVPLFGSGPRAPALLVYSQPEIQAAADGLQIKPRNPIAGEIIRSSNVQQFVDGPSESAPFGAGPPRPDPYGPVAYRPDPYGPVAYRQIPFGPSGNYQPGYPGPNYPRSGPSLTPNGATRAPLLFTEPFRSTPVSNEPQFFAFTNPPTSGSKTPTVPPVTTPNTPPRPPEEPSIFLFTSTSRSETTAKSTPKQGIRVLTTPFGVAWRQGRFFISQFGTTPHPATEPALSTGPLDSGVGNPDRTPPNISTPPVLRETLATEPTLITASIEKPQSTPVPIHTSTEQPPSTAGSVSEPAQFPSTAVPTDQTTSAAILNRTASVIPTLRPEIATANIGRTTSSMPPVIIFTERTLTLKTKPITASPTLTTRLGNVFVFTEPPASDLSPTTGTPPRNTVSFPPEPANTITTSSAAPSVTPTVLDHRGSSPLPTEPAVPVISDIPSSTPPIPAIPNLPAFPTQPVNFITPSPARLSTANIPPLSAPPSSIPTIPEIPQPISNQPINFVTPSVPQSPTSGITELTPTETVKPRTSVPVQGTFTSGPIASATLPELHFPSPTPSILGSTEKLSTVTIESRFPTISSQETSPEQPTPVEGEPVTPNASIRPKVFQHIKRPESPAPNRIRGKPHILCMANGIMFIAESYYRFDGIIFARGRENRANCSYDSTRNYAEISDRSINVSFPYIECGEPIPAKEGDHMYQTDVVVSFRDGRVQTFLARCVSQKLRYDVDELPKKIEEALEELNITPTKIESQAPMPMCTMRVVQEFEQQNHKYGPSNASAINDAFIGQQLRMEFALNPPSAAFGFLIRNCTVWDSTIDTRYVIIDDKGCSVDINIFAHPHYDTYHDLAIVHWHAFKVPDSAALSFRCDCVVCTDVVDEETGQTSCEQIPTPPICPDVVTSSTLQNALIFDSSQNAVKKKKRREAIDQNVRAGFCLSSADESRSNCTIDSSETGAAIDSAMCFSKLIMALSLGFNSTLLMTAISVFCVCAHRHRGDYTPSKEHPPEDQLPSRRVSRAEIAPKSPSIADSISSINP